MELHLLKPQLSQMWKCKLEVRNIMFNYFSSTKNGPIVPEAHADSRGKWLDEIYFLNGSDHEVVACYSRLYEEGEVEHINGVWPAF